VIDLTLADLINEAAGGGRLAGDGSVRVSHATSDSRQVRAGSLFVALAPETEKALAHARDAITRGAVAVASRLELALDVPSIVTETPGRLLGHTAERLLGNPTSELVAVGVTGTNGKTTTTQILEQALLALGSRPALIGTGVMRGPQGEEPSVFTTPFGDAISRFARDAKDAGATHLLMEVSSHALEQGRADGVAFRVGAFTNLTRDHLDYHGTMEAYGASKARFFTDFALQHAVIHTGDEFGKTLARATSARVHTVAVDAPAELHVTDATYGVTGTVATLATPEGPATLRSPLVGRHNLENLLVALGCLLALDVPLADALRALGSARGAEGRLERVEHAALGVFVDYAHTPDAIERVLAALRPLTEGRLVVVFGCGGDRDRGKRPAMARAAVEGADLVVVTSDNPRTEAPERIVEDVVAGIDVARSPRLELASLASARAGHLVVLDRRAAIATVIEHAKPGDTVLLAGKGHEDYQIIGTTKFPFDDRVEARHALALRGAA
jgi:UDP-N-acetylmuramoyl-L-alanyl-D-glutamate--2,6-diaminopimelate ligase